MKITITYLSATLIPEYNEIINDAKSVEKQSDGRLMIKIKDSNKYVFVPAYLTIARIEN